MNDTTMKEARARAWALWRGRSALVVGAVALVMAGCGGGGGTSVEEPEPIVAQPGEGALAASSPGELMDFIRTKLQDRNAQQRVVSGDVFFGGVLVTTSESADANGAIGAAAATSVERSGTTVQEQGVDEADLLKTDGDFLYSLQSSPFGVTGQPTARVQAHRRLGDGSVQKAGLTVLPFDKDANIVPQGLYLASGAQRVAVLGQSQLLYRLDLCDGRGGCDIVSLLPEPPQRVRETVALDLLSTTDPANPVLTDRLSIDGRLIGSRLIGNLLYLVTQHSPQLAVEALPTSVPDSERAAMVAGLKSSDVLPTIRINGGAAQPLVVETDCYVQPKNASLGIEITTVTVIDLQASGLSRSSRCFVGGTEALYMSNSSLYLATTRYAYTVQAEGLRFAPQTSTDLHKFSLNGAVIDYRGSGEVEGHLGWDWQKRSYRMSEWNGDLRVLTFTGETGWFMLTTADPAAMAPSPATLTILRERSSDHTLQRVATLPNAQRPAALGKPGEQVYAVRLIGDRGYVVTFRRTDPLYVLDLSNPADPKAVGELLIPGFSDYLFPMGNGLLFGIGKDATDTGQVGGVKLALFDVADPAKPLQLGVRTYGKSGSQSALDHSSHGVNLFSVGSTMRVALPIYVQDGSGATQRGLQRVEIDTAARTMVDKPLIVAGEQSGGGYRLLGDRSVQIGDKVYYLADEQLGAWDW